MKLKLILIVAMLFCGAITVHAAANWQVSTLGCTPSEVAVGSSFSCTAQIQNIGDATGTLGTATLYPDVNDWLELSSYPKAVSQSVAAGNSVEVTFTGLKAKISGNNGFSKIMLDSVTGTDNVDSVRVNAISVLAVGEAGAGTLASGGSTNVSVEVTAGGNMDVTLTFSGSSGCSISGQDASKTITGLQNGNKQSRAWTVTVGSSRCSYTVTASATGANGIASVSDTATGTILCSNCVESSGSSSSGSSGSGGGDSAAAAAPATTPSSQVAPSATVVAFSTPVSISKGKPLSFSIRGELHTATLVSVTSTSATLSIASTPQTVTVNVGSTVNVNLNNDNTYDLSIKLVSVDVAAGTADFVFTPVSIDMPTSAADDQVKKPINGEKSGIMRLIEKAPVREISWIFTIVAVIVVVWWLVHHRKKNPKKPWEVDFKHNK